MKKFEALEEFQKRKAEEKNNVSCVLCYQILTEHSLQSGETTDQEGILHSLEGLHGNTALSYAYGQ